MSTYKYILASALLAASPAFAQNLLDNQLNDKPAPSTTPATPAATAPTPKTAPAPENPGGNAINSPDAVKKVDDDELLAQLMKPGQKADPQAVAERLKNMVTRMGDTADRLSSKDPGQVTQEVQRRIIADLDVMIELARQQQQNSSSSSQSQQQQQGQQRQQSQGQEGPKGNEGGTTAANSDPIPRGGYSDPTGNDMRNHDPANWGGLPPRDRDQISHGANEQYLSSYKEMIDRYYQALAEIGKTKH